MAAAVSGGAPLGFVPPQSQRLFSWRRRIEGSQCGCIPSLRPGLPNLPLPYWAVAQDPRIQYPTIIVASLIVDHGSGQGALGKVGKVDRCLTASGWRRRKTGTQRYDFVYPTLCMFGFFQHIFRCSGDAFNGSCSETRSRFRKTDRTSQGKEAQGRYTLFNELLLDY